MAHGSYIDTLAEKYPNMGAYVYCANNPVKLVDPDGNDWYEAEDGEMKHTDHHYESQADFNEKSGLKGIWKDYTCEKNDKYYSSFGEVIDSNIDKESASIYKLIDKSIINYETPVDQDMYSSEVCESPSTDFSEIAYSGAKSGGFKASVTRHSKQFEYNGASVIVNTTDNKNATRLKFDGEQSLSKITSAGPFTNGAYRTNLSYKFGIPIVELKFNDKNRKDDFIRLYNSLFGKSK